MPKLPRVAKTLQGCQNTSGSFVWRRHPEGGQGWHNGLADLLGANLLALLDGERGTDHLPPLMRRLVRIQRQGWEQEETGRREVARGVAAAAQELAREREREQELKREQEQEQELELELELE